MSITFIACHEDAIELEDEWPDTGALFNPKLSVVYEGSLTPNNSEIHVETAPAGIDRELHLRFVVSNLSEETLTFGANQWIDNPRFSISPPPPEELRPDQSTTLNIYTNPFDLVEESSSVTSLSAPDSDINLIIVAKTPSPLRMGLIGDAGYQLWSDNYGQSFTEIYAPATLSEVTKSIAWGAGRFLLAGANSGSTSATGVWRYSDDGISWTESAAENAFSATDCTYGLNRFACVREDVLSSSIDGVQIDHRPALHEYKMNAIVALDDRFIAVGRGGRQAVSFDGQTWESESFSNEPDPYHDLATNGESLVAVGGVNRYHVSVSIDKGESWTDVPFGNCIGNSLERIVQNNGIYLVQGSSECHHNMNRSENGFDWEPVTSLHPFDRYHLLGAHNGWFFAWKEDGDGNRYVARSKQGDEWETVHHLPPLMTLKSMAAEQWDAK